MVRPIAASNWNQAATQPSPAGDKTADSCFELILRDCHEKPYNDFLDCFVITFLAMTSWRTYEESAETQYRHLRKGVIANECEAIQYHWIYPV